jgi:ABC-type transport system involved in cytochrome bd biosynthesis fused ATPase/permease subunit
MKIKINTVLNKVIYTFKILSINFDTYDYKNLFFAIIFVIASSLISFGGYLLTIKLFEKNNFQNYEIYEISILIIIFFSSKIISKLILDFKWKFFNLSLYRIAYKFGVTSLNKYNNINSRSFLFNNNNEKNIFLSLFTKSQDSVISFLYIIFSSFLPIFIELIIAIILIFYSFDKLIALTISTAIVFYTLITFIFKNKEIIVNQSAFIQDNKVLETQIDFIDSLPISVQYNKNQYFNKIINIQITKSLELHKTLFDIKFTRAFLNTISLFFLYFITILLLIILSPQSIYNLSFIYLLFTIFDRVIQPINSLTLQLVEIRDAMLSILEIDNYLKSKRSNIKMTNGFKSHINSINIFNNEKTHKVLLKNKIWVVLGNSGSGKSTLSRHLYYLFSNNINDELNLTFPITNNSEINYISNSIVYLSSEPFHIHGTCKQNIIFDDEILLNKIDLSLLSQFQLDTSILNRDVNTISRGESQRISIIRALIRNPKVIILDEATNGLDLQLESAIISFINHYLQDSLIIIVTHRSSNLLNPNLIFHVNSESIDIQTNN